MLESYGSSSGECQPSHLIQMQLELCLHPFDFCFLELKVLSTKSCHALRFRGQAFDSVL